VLDIAERIEGAFERHAARPALCICGIAYSYRALSERVLKIQSRLDEVALSEERLIGVVATDSLDTYAAVIAILRSGRAFVPLDPQHPVARNCSVVRRAELRTVLMPLQCGLAPEALAGTKIVRTCEALTATPAAVARVMPHDLAYLLFTSGSTGEPKGVPIKRASLSAFLDAMESAGYATTPDDRVLQMFSLTFDFSIAAYLAPLSYGACVYTVASSSAKFAEVYRLLDEERLTVAPLVPSVLGLLRPYFHDIHLPSLRLSMFCGEALHADLANSWMRCAPNSVVANFYGPTEATVFALVYHWQPAVGRDKTLNGIVSIGQPMALNQTLVVDDYLLSVPPSHKGELCLAGPQLSGGYWRDPERSASAFFKRASPEEGGATLFYRTGDLVIHDTDGNFLFCGRSDEQVKVQGHRVELGDIEHHAREVTAGHNCVVVACTGPSGSVELHLVIENHAGDLKNILSSLRDRIPSYMVPGRAISVSRLPRNANGKFDRLRLQRNIEGASMRERRS
jgi:amino acid adenylation domain-containing protein